MNHQQIYQDHYFFREQDNASYRENRLRFGDQFSAICYTFGIHFLDVFKHYINLTSRDFDRDLPYPNDRSFFQFDIINNIYNSKRYLRNPKSIIEIGSGRGEIIAFLNYTKMKIPFFNYELQSVDVAPEFEKMYNDTCNRLFECELPSKLIIGTLEEKYKEFNYDNVDTIIMSEVLEHLSEDEFWKFLNHALPYLKKNNTRLIIVNGLGFWPIEKNDYDHVWRIDDSVYDQIQALARSTIIRSGSHLVVEF